MPNNNTSNERTFRARVSERDFEVRVDRDEVSLVGGAFYSVAGDAGGRINLLRDGKVCSALTEPGPSGDVTVWLNGYRMEVALQDERDVLLDRYGLENAEKHRHREVHAPMPGLVVRTLVAEGDVVERGQGLLVLEAMKMENEIRADAAGTISRVHVSAGEAVSKNALLLEFET